MDSQKLSTQVSRFTKPQIENAKSLIVREKEFDQNYVIYRVKLQPLEVSKTTRNIVLEAMNANKTYIQIDEYTIMINSISAIEPLQIKDKETWEKHQQMKESFEKNDR